MEDVDCIVIGAGVVGLAVARALAMDGREVIIVEKEEQIGTGISSRNSEVIHAGMYYPKDSAKARYCVAGNCMLRDFAASHSVPFEMVGKLIVATNPEEERALSRILAAGQTNGVTGLRSISGAIAIDMEPSLSCTAALWSPDTGIVDSHAYMLALLGEAGAHGAMIAYQTSVQSGRPSASGGLEMAFAGETPMKVRARAVVIAAGLGSVEVAGRVGLPCAPRVYLCKGNYFTLTGKSPFRRLVYPVPVQAGLGVHYTLDMAGRGRFGPDVEWVTRENYTVNPSRSNSFYDAIRCYWPGLPDGALEPGYAGIRPKLQPPGEPAKDFHIAGPADHGVEGVVALYGIESPGLTASLALAEAVRALLQ